MYKVAPSLLIQCSIRSSYLLMALGYWSLFKILGIAVISYLYDKLFLSTLKTHFELVDLLIDINRGLKSVN